MANRTEPYFVELNRAEMSLLADIPSRLEDVDHVYLDRLFKESPLGWDAAIDIYNRLASKKLVVGGPIKVVPAASRKHGETYYGLTYREPLGDYNLGVVIQIVQEGKETTVISPPRPRQDEGFKWRYEYFDDPVFALQVALSNARHFHFPAYVVEVNGTSITTKYLVEPNVDRMAVTKFSPDLPEPIPMGLYQATPYFGDQPKFRQYSTIAAGDNVVPLLFGRMARGDIIKDRGKSINSAFDRRPRR